VSNPGRAAGRRFDRDHHVTTQAILFLEDLDSETVGDARAHATHYEAVPIADFKAMVATIPADHIKRSTFVDIGSGMGRAIFLASQYPFKQVIGVEVSPGLHEVAKENLKTATGFKQACKDVRLVREDARLYSFPPGDLVVFLYNPFDEQALEQVLNAIKTTRKEHDVVYLLYHTAVYESLFPNDRRIAELPCGLVSRIS
jgi:predicted RNA methylase